MLSGDKMRRTTSLLEGAQNTFKGNWTSFRYFILRIKSDQYKVFTDPVINEPVKIRLRKFYFSKHQFRSLENNLSLIKVGKMAKN